MSDIYGLLILSVVFISLLLLLKTLSKPKQSHFEKYLNKDQDAAEVNPMQIREIRGLRSYLPSNIMFESKRYEMPISLGQYWLVVILSGIGISVAGYYLLGKSEHALFGGVLAFLIPKFLVYQRKKKYYITLLDRVATYMKAVANTVSIQNNLVYVMEEIHPLMSPDIQVEIEKAKTLLESGMPPSRAFQQMNEKYNFKELYFFHEMLSIANREGAKDSFETLIEIVRDFEKQKVLLSRLKSGLTQAKKAFMQNAIIILLMPFALMLLSPEMYENLGGSFIGKVAIIVNIIIVFFLYTRVEKIASFNPTERSK